MRQVLDKKRSEQVKEAVSLEMEIVFKEKFGK